MRIYKGSEITLRLYNPYKIEDGLVDVILYTTNPKLAYKIKDATVEGNIVYVKINKSTFNNMEDGVINYIILDEVYNTERQSSYYLKTPEDYVAKSVQTSKDIYIVDNGDYKILPDEDYSSIEEVNVHVEFDAEPYIQRGFELGVETQKSKLESVSITENGTYTREDGYNEIHVEVPDLNGDYQTGYDEGYEAGIDYASENAGEIAAQTARVLDVTKNGSYLSQYSEPVYPDAITGIYPDGTNFYNYVKLDKYDLVGSVYNTNIIPTENTKLEFWYKHDDAQRSSNGFIISNMNSNTPVDERFYVYYFKINYEIITYIGKSSLSFVIESDKWYHIEMSYAEGLIVNGEKIGDYTQNINLNNSNPFIINSAYNDLQQSEQSCCGYFGMIKIKNNDIENVIIPTADGFKNVNTEHLLDRVYYQNTEEIYEYTEATLSDGNTVTGVYDDGTEFYSYASLNGKVFDTGIPVAEDSKIDFWWNDNMEAYSNYYVNVGAQESSGFIFKICEKGDGRMGYEYGYGSPQSSSFDITKGGWHHFVMSKQEGVFVDDVLIATINRNFQTDNYPTFNINASFDSEINSNANGLYGMIKITSNGVENIIIPTADGFKNITTNEMLSIKREGSYAYIEITDDGKGNIQTGDGDFYSNVKLNNMCFDTGIDATKDTRIELWHKPIFNDVDEYYFYYGLVSSDNIIKSYYESKQIRGFGLIGDYANQDFCAQIGYSQSGMFNLSNIWNHIIISGDDGLNINGFKKSRLMKIDPFNLRLYINHNGTKGIASGYYGMIKITKDGETTTIIPTPNGFLNTNTNEYLTQVPFNDYLLGYNFTEQNIIYPEGNLIKEVHINVQPEKIDVGNDLIFYGSQYKIIPDIFDFSNTTNGEQLFYFSKIQKIPESLDTSKITNAKRIFASTNIPVEDFYNLNFENCMSFDEPLGSVSIKDYSFLTNWNMPSIAGQDEIVKNGDVEYVPALPNTGENAGIYASGIIYNYSDFTKLTYFGGYIGRTENMENKYVLAKCPNLSYESCKSILENLYDFTGHGEVPKSSQGKLKVHPNFLTTIGDEISIGINKGWSITA